MLTDSQKDWLSVGGLGLAAVQTLIATIALFMNRQQAAQPASAAALKWAIQLLGKIVFCVFLFEIAVIITAFSSMLDNSPWAVWVGYVHSFEAAVLGLLLIVVFFRSKKSAVISLVYLIGLTVAAVLALQYRVSVQDLKAASPRDIGMFFRTAAEPLFMVFAVTSAWSLLAIIKGILGQVMEALLERNFDEQNIYPTEGEQLRKRDPKSGRIKKTTQAASGTPSASGRTAVPDVSQQAADTVDE